MNIDEFIALGSDLKLYILTKKNYLFELIKNYGMRITDLARFDYEMLELINTEYLTIAKLVTETDVTVSMLLERNEPDLISTIISHTQEICSFSKNTGINASKILSPVVSDLQVYRILCDIEWLQVLVNYYFINFDEILQLPAAKLNQLLDVPSMAPQFLKDKTRDVNDLLLAQIVAKHLIML